MNNLSLNSIRLRHPYVLTHFGALCVSISAFTFGSPANLANAGEATISPPARRTAGLLVLEKTNAPAPQLDSGATSVQALNQALADLEGDYDPEARMVISRFSSPGYHTTLKEGMVHRTRRSLSYAVGCLDSEDSDLHQRGLDIIERVIQLQDTDPDSKTYGIWPWFLEEPLDRMSPPDWNWADFCGVQLLQAVLYHRDKFPPALLSKVEQSIYHAAQSIKRRNVGPGYTNIAIMGTYVTMMTAELLNLPELKDYARQRLQRFYDYTMETGAFQEYNSPTYTIVALEELGRMHAHFSDPQAKVLVDELYRLAWEEIAIHFHPPTQQWAGPHSRSYSTLLPNSTLSFLQSQTSDAVRFLGTGPHVDLEARRLRCPCPEDLERYFIELTSPRQTERRYSTGDRPVIGTTYLDPAFCLGTVNRGDFWNQKRSLIAYWGSAESPSYLHLRFLHDDYDFSAAHFFSTQEKGMALFGVVLATDGGDTHISLDRLKNGRFKARDLRLRFELGGQAATIPVASADSLDRMLELSFPTLTLKMSLPYAALADHPIHWESGQSGGKAYYDAVFYEGPEREFDLRSMKEAAAAGGVAFAAEPEDLPQIQQRRVGNMLHLQWGDLNLAFPVAPATRQLLQQSVE